MRKLNRLNLIYFCTVMCMIMVLSLKNVKAESYLEYDGKLHMKTDRVQETEDRKLKESSVTNQTEMEKNNLDLFKTKTEEKINRIVEKKENKLQEIQQYLFQLEAPKKVKTLEEKKKALFSKDYVGKMVHKNVVQSNNLEKKNNKTLIGSVLSGVIILVGSLYYTGRKVWE